VCDATRSTSRGLTGYEEVQTKRKVRAFGMTTGKLRPGSGHVTAFRIVDHTRQSLWFVPVTCVIVGVALSFATLWIDERFDHDLIPRSLTGGPDAALAVLAAVATSMVSLAALVLTITMVVVQLAMGQFSPRIVQTILKDKPSQFAIGIFVGTFAHAMLAMRDVVVGGGQVPGLAVVVAYLLVIVSIAVLVLYVHHIGRSLRVSALIEFVGEDTRRLLDAEYPDKGERPEHEIPTIPATASGVLCHVEFDRLVAAAKDADCTLELVPAFGEFAAAGAPLLRVHGDPSRLPDDVTAPIVLGLERTLEQDVAFRQLALHQAASALREDGRHLRVDGAAPADRAHAVHRTGQASARCTRSRS
jgi:uncharacterized membrane protein